MGASRSATRDAISALQQTAVSSHDNLFRSWILVPSGILVTLAACFGVDTLLRHLDVPFPASVACLLLLFAALLMADWLLGSHRTRRIVSIIDVSAGWSLRWISVFFTPAFVLLPLSPPIGVVEVFKIIAVFLIGFFIMMAAAAYLTRSIQLLIGTSKRTQEHLTDNIPLTSGIATPTPSTSAAATIVASPIDSPANSPMVSSSPAPSRPQTPPQLRLQDHHHGQISLQSLSSAPPSRTAAAVQSALAQTPSQAPVPPTRAERWTASLTANIHLVTWTALFLFAGLPVYYATGYAMPIHLCLNVLAYFAAAAIPARWKTYLHPVLVSSLFTCLLIWALAATRSTSLESALAGYRTGAKYTNLWSPSSSSSSSNTPQLGESSRRPGAGDIFASLLDASIVSLALPMFQHRRELRAHLIAILVPNISISIISLLVYPPLCYAVGITAQRSLAFASRSLTLALAQPATENLGGDVNTVAALAIISGILGVLCGQRVLAFLKIPEDDYVTRGITLGINSSAIATALLLRTDPRAAALSSLSMILFGTVTVLFTSIPPAAAAVRSFVGLQG